MTNAVGKGSVNLSVNVALEERSLWGRLGFAAVQRGEVGSVGDYMRRVMLRGLQAESPKDAERLIAIRRKRVEIKLRCCALLALITAQTVAVLAGMDRGDDPLARRVRSARSVTVAGRRFETEA